MRRAMIFTATTFLAVLAVPVVSAQTVVPPVLDSVSFNLSAEDWVRSDTAMVTLTVDLAGSGNSGTVRSDVLKAISGISSKAQWRVVAISPQSDSAGLERWQAQLQARLPEDELSALSERATKASKPGLQVRVAQIAFDPTLAETEAVRAGLRDRIYADVDAEVKRLNKAFPGRNYRAGDISFSEQGAPPNFDTKLAVAAPRAVATAFAGVQARLQMQAQVTLSAFAAP